MKYKRSERGQARKVRDLQALEGLDFKEVSEGE